MVPWAFFASRLRGNVRVWLATAPTDICPGFPSLTRLVQESLKRNPRAGDLYVFRGHRGDLIKIIWHDGQGVRAGARPLSVAIAGRRCCQHQRCAIIAYAWN